MPRFYERKTFTSGGIEQRADLEKKCPAAFDFLKRLPKGVQRDECLVGVLAEMERSARSGRPFSVRRCASGLGVVRRTVFTRLDELVGVYDADLALRVRFRRNSRYFRPVDDVF